jgi:hypothetical protein
MKPDKITISLGVLIILTAISWISSCTHQPDPNSLPIICYTEVKTIISAKCYNVPTASNPQACHDLSGEGPYFGSDQGITDQVSAGNPEGSPLYNAITTVRGESKMPPDHPLAQESRTQIRIWIEQGAHIDACPGDTAILSEGNNELFNK